MLQGELLEFLEETADAAFCVNQQGEICSWNVAAKELFGYTGSEVIGKSLYIVLQGRGALGTKVCACDFYARHATAEHCKIPNFDVEVTDRSGHRMWVDLSTLMFKDGRTHPRLFVHLARDITKRKHQEQLLHTMLQISKRIVAMSDGNGNGIARPAPVLPLSEQEQGILRLFSEGKNSAEIAGNLGITLQTSRNHLHHANEKLGTHSRLEAVTHAMRRRLI